MTLVANMIAAELAVKYANDMLRGRSSNRGEDIVHTLQDNLRRQNANSAHVDDIVLDVMADRRETARLSTMIYQARVPQINNARDDRAALGQRLNAQSIITDNIGNCFEHAVLACHYLNGRGIASYMADTDDNTNHSFVLIDAPGGLDGQTVNVTRLAPGGIAGAFTVVCDPWYHEWFAVQQDWARKMWSIFGTTTKYPPIPATVPLKLTSGAHVT